MEPDSQSTEMIDRMLAAVRGRPARDRLVVHLVAEYELSLAEALGATLVDDEASTLDVEDKYGRRRTLELAGDAAAALDELRNSSDSRRLFTSRSGRSFGRPEARRLLLSAARDAGLAEFSLRELRRRILLAA